MKAREQHGGYMPQLDGLRALAVGGVLIDHFVPKAHALNVALHWGRLGVLLFFVLSGFLITGLLIDAKGRSGAGSLLRRFYARRFLRIFPIYYLTILAVCIMDPGFRALAGWHLLYLSNMAGPLGGIDFGYSGHLWTLAVEEQFYLLWPLAVLAVPNRRLKDVALTLVLCSVALKLTGGLWAVDLGALRRPLWGNFDSLCAGGYLAIVSRERGEVRIPIFVPILAMGGLLFPGTHEGSAILPVLEDVSNVALSAYLIAGASRGFQGWFGWGLEVAPVRYMGRISYGIYLYHLFIFGLIPGLGGLGWVAATLVLSALSWELLEKPINNLKRHFAYEGDEGPKGLGAGRSADPEGSVLAPNAPGGK